MTREPGGFWRRLGANLLDGLLFMPFYILMILAFNVSEDTTNGILGWVQILYMLILPVVWVGYTVGKKAMGVQIVRIDGKKITFFTMLKRVILGMLVHVLTFGIGYIVSAFMVGLREDKRAIHDFIAGTQVVRDDE